MLLETLAPFAVRSPSASCLSSCSRVHYAVATNKMYSFSLKNRNDTVKKILIMQISSKPVSVCMKEGANLHVRSLTSRIGPRPLGQGRPRMPGRGGQTFLFLSCATFSRVLEEANEFMNRRMRTAGMERGKNRGHCLGSSRW